MTSMTKKKLEYRLPFSSLEDGVHVFEFTIGQDFMELFPETDVFFAPQVRVDLELVKSDRLMEMRFRFEGVARSLCDRCLREVEFPVRIEENVVAKLSSEATEVVEEDEFWTVPEKDSSLDLAPYFHEILVLSRPMQLFCPENEKGEPTCDPKMLAYYDRSSDIEESEPETDPRWAALAGLRDKMED